MKKTSFFLIILIFSSTITIAQTPVKLGIGVSTNFYATNTGYQNAAKISLDIFNFRVEPFLALTNFKGKSEPDPNLNGSFDSENQKNILFGFNFIYLVLNENSQFYLGTGIGFEKSNYNYESRSGNSFYSYELEKTGFVFIPAIGGEYLLSPEFSLGVEFNYHIRSLSGSSTETESNQATNRGKNKNNVSTLGTYFTARYYLNL